MRLDRLQIDLRPRPHAQALDLGFALLRSHAVSVYLAWLALWLPLVTLCAGLSLLFPVYAAWWGILAWWLKPFLERAPLYVLSRKVFGEEVTWQGALRAWPEQLRGGWFRLLWWRPFAAGRGLYQAIWQLEGARGKTAAQRRNVIGKDNTNRSAVWFGVACAHFEAILQLGVMGFIGIFFSYERLVNPFSSLIDSAKFNSPLFISVAFFSYALASGIIGPIYTACCFTLYLNRRATLEAWDIEIALRQIQAPRQKTRPVAAKALLGALLASALVLAAGVVEEAHGAAKPSASLRDQDKAADQKCMPPDLGIRTEARLPAHTPEQAQLRGEVDRLYDTDDLRGYVCENGWSPKKTVDKPAARDMPNLAVLAQIVKICLIAALIGLVCWLLYRYRDTWRGWIPQRRIAPASIVAGLDIRPETLPDDVPAAVRALWAAGQMRAALALLYRATLSRLVNQDGLQVANGATEGDCLRLATRAHTRGQLGTERLRICTTVTEIWLNGAYAKRWPDNAALLAGCAAWESQFGAAKQKPSEAAV